jgi:hypothetical protein
MNPPCPPYECAHMWYVVLNPLYLTMVINWKLFCLIDNFFIFFLQLIFRDFTRELGVEDMAWLKFGFAF